MSHPDPRHPAEVNGAYPYELPVHDSAITGTGTGMPGADTRRYEEWHHADPPPRGAGGWDAMREFGPPPDWTDEGVFVAGDGDRSPEWDTGRASPTPPYGTPPRHTARRLPARLIATTAVVFLCITAITFVMFSRNHTIRISAADNPGATASQHAPSVRSGSSSPAAQPPAITRTGAERVLTDYWRVNNAANQSRSDALLATIEAGSSYTMDAGAYQMSRVTDPSNSQYAPFTAENAVYYIPRQPAGVYPRWFAARITYATLASPQHVTGAGYVLFLQDAKDAAWKNVLEPYLLLLSRASAVHRNRRPGLRDPGSPDIRSRTHRPSRTDPAAHSPVAGWRVSHAEESRQPRRPARPGILPVQAAGRISRHRPARHLRPGLRPEDRRRRRAGVLPPHRAAQP